MSSQKSSISNIACAHFRVVEVQIRLMTVEAVPEVRARDRVPTPVRRLEILKDDPRLLVLVRRVAPHVPVAPRRARLAPPRALKPLVLVRRVVHHQLGDDAQLAAVRFFEKRLEVVQRAVLRIDVRVVGDVVTIVLQRRGKERQQPDRRDAQVLDVVEPLGQAAEVADAVAVAVAECAHVQLVDDRVLVPKRRAAARCCRRSAIAVADVDSRLQSRSSAVAMARALRAPSARIVTLSTGNTQNPAPIASAGACGKCGPGKLAGRAPRSCDFRATSSGRRSASRASDTAGRRAGPIARAAARSSRTAE